MGLGGGKKEPSRLSMGCLWGMVWKERYESSAVLKGVERTRTIFFLILNKDLFAEDPKWAYS